MLKHDLYISSKDILKENRTPRTALTSIMYRSSRFPLYQIELDLILCWV